MNDISYWLKLRVVLDLQWNLVQTPLLYVGAIISRKMLKIY